MPAFFRALRFLPASMLLSSSILQAQGMPVRVEAIHLLERANAVSRPAHMMRGPGEKTHPISKSAAASRFQ